MTCFLKGMICLDIEILVIIRDFVEKNGFFLLLFDTETYQFNFFFK